MRKQRNVPNERTGQNTRKRTKQNGDNLTGAELKTLVIRCSMNLEEE